MLEVKSTKRFKYLPCGHAQYFDKNPDGSPGHCASVHGYDREVDITFAGDIDEHGWIVPFGDLKPIKEFLEYYYDHVTILGADDPRLADIPAQLREPGGVLGTLRVLPSGVSMEMSSVFIWEWVNAFVYKITSGRCYVAKVHCFEHDRNTAFVEVDRETASENAQRIIRSTTNVLPMMPNWEFEAPLDLIKRINDI
jgi:6-pyruvoyl-tetrahydropterin synthase